MTNARKRFALLLAALTVLVSSCDVSTLLPARPTVIPVDTVVAQTAAAAFTQTQALITPTETPTLTPTPTATETATPTMTLTPFLSASAGELTCRVLNQSVRNGTHFGPRERFEMGWKVRNNSGVNWDPGDTDFAYFSGTRMYQAESLTLPEGVHTGAAVGLSAGMVSPKKDGTYTTVWALRRGENRFCKVTLRIIVP